MTLCRCSAAACAWLGVVVALAAADLDLSQPQSPPRPAPKWLKMAFQGANDPRLKGYRAPEGLKVEIAAEEPAVINPVGLAFADDGRLFVLERRPSPGDEQHETEETITYKDGSKRHVTVRTKQVKDVVKVLALDKDSNISARGEVILEDELPSSLLLHDDWLYLAGRGTVRRCKQSKPDGPYDVKEILARGFAASDDQELGLVLGDDGWLYITCGDGDHIVEGRDGSRAVALRTGAVFRCRPDGSQMETFAIGFCDSQGEAAFDALGNLFHVDGSKLSGGRLLHVPAGADFGWRLRPGSRAGSPDVARTATFGERPGTMAPLLRTGRGTPTGLLVYHDTRLPEPYRGLLLCPDQLRRSVKAYRVEPQGATFAVAEEFDLLDSNDPLFRPCQAVVGPDGAIYVCDRRTDTGGAGRLWGDGRHGRIYRISWAGTGDEPAIPLRNLNSWAGLATLSDDDLLRALGSEDLSDRRRARAELRRRGDKHRPALLNILGDTDQLPATRLAALGVLRTFWSDEVRDACLALLNDKEADLRRQAAEALGRHGKRGDRKVHDALLQVLGDPDLPVRRAVVLAMGQIAGEGAADNLVNALAFDDSKDAVLRDGLVRAIESVGDLGMDRLLALAESGAPKDLDKVVAAFTALRSKAGARALPELLKHPHLSVEQRTALVRSYRNYLFDPPLSLKPLLDHVTGRREAAAVNIAALEVLAESDLLDGDRGRGWVAELLQDNNLAVRVAAYRAVADARLTRLAPRLVMVLGNARLTEAERLAALQALTTVGDKEAVPALQAICAGQDTDTKPLRSEALRGLGRIDPTTAAAEAKTWLDSTDFDQLRTAVQILGTQPEGARLVGQRLLEKKMPAELHGLVLDVLRRHAAKDAEAAKLLGDLNKPAVKLSLEPADVTRTRELIRTKGDPQRGKELFLKNTALACTSCHMMEGVGRGGVGPDLTRSWETLSLEKVLKSLLEPSKEVMEGFQSYRVATKKGPIYAGRVLARTPRELVLRGGDGRDVRIDAADLEEVAPARTSLMPDNVLVHLSLEQFLDLAAFLRDRQAQESLREPAGSPP